MTDESFDLEMEALRASGVEERRIVHYTGQLTIIQQRLLDQGLLSDDPLTRAKQVFEWLWKERPNRYKQKGHYKLCDVIESQLCKENRDVGNCLGLTILYNCLLRRIGIHAGALYLENAFGISPHVLTVLRKKDIDIEIENILPKGFDYKGHLKNPSRTRWGNPELVADICHSLGNELFEKGKLREALKNYDRAITLNPAYEKAQLNRLMVIDKLKRVSL